MFSGSYVALVTPFTESRGKTNVDEKALRALVEYQIVNGTQGLVPVGTTGESSTLSHEEHKRVVEIVVDQCDKRVPVIAGAGSNNPEEALVYMQYAEEIGADGALCVAGYYNRPNQQGLYEHFKYLHDNSNLPMIIYNIPPRAIVDVLPRTMERLSQLTRVVGVKDATGDLCRISEERELISQEFSYFSGDDISALGYNALGGNGFISVTANAAPLQCAMLQKACEANDYQAAREIHKSLMPLHQALFLEPSPAGIKYATSMLNLGNAAVRRPILEVSKSTKEAIELALKGLGLL